jgi:CheY-like chemotaxis protein
MSNIGRTPAEVGRSAGRMLGHGPSAHGSGRRERPPISVLDPPRGGMSMPNEPLPTPARRVVLVDARDERRQLMRRVIEGDDARAILVGEADTQAAALAVVGEQQADVAIVDARMPLSEGLATVAALRERYPQLGILVCSFDLDRATAEQAIALGADSCLAKPVDRTDLRTALKGLPDRPGEDWPGARVDNLPAGASAR